MRIKGVIPFIKEEVSPGVNDHSLTGCLKIGNGLSVVVETA